MSPGNGCHPYSLGLLIRRFLRSLRAEKPALPPVRTGGGTSRPGGGGEDASENNEDDFDATWVGSSGAADDFDADERTVELPKGEARRLQSWYPP